MIKTWITRSILALHPLAPLLYRLSRDREPHLCIITPVFDPALEPLRSLIGDLQRQSFQRFRHISISNGPSPKIKELIHALWPADARFIYDEIEFSPTPDWQSLLMNLARRRTYALRKYRAARYVFIDADSALASTRYLAKLYVADRVLRRDVLVTQTRFAPGTLFPQGAVLPLFPVKLGTIDITNYTFSRRIAEQHEYPPDIDPQYGAANDYRYFQRISDANNTAYLPVLGVLKDARRSYRSVTDVWMGSNR